MRGYKVSGAFSNNDTNPIGSGVPLLWPYLTLLKSLKALSPNTVTSEVRAPRDKFADIQFSP